VSLIVWIVDSEGIAHRHAIRKVMRCVRDGWFSLAWIHRWVRPL
jgi:hypothetical protein